MYTAVARVNGGGVLEVFTEWGMKATNGSTVNSGSWLRASVEAGLRPTQVIPLVPLRLLTMIGRGTLCSRSEAGYLQTAVVTATLPALCIRSLFKFTPCEAPKGSSQVAAPSKRFLNCTSANDDVVCLENVCAFSRDFYHVKDHLFQSSQGTQCVRTLKDEYFHPDL